MPQNMPQNNPPQIISIWKKSTSLDFSEKAWIANFINTNQTIRISVFNCTPFVYLTKENAIAGGTEIRLAKEVTKGLPVKFSLVQTTDKWGLWAASLKTLEQNTRDLSLCAQFLPQAAEYNLDFTDPFTQMSLTFLVPKPNLMDQHTYIFQPLHLKSWLIFFFFMVYLSGALSFTNYVYGKLGVRNGLLTENLYSTNNISLLKNPILAKNIFSTENFSFKQQLLDSFFLSWRFFCLSPPNFHYSNTKIIFKILMVASYVNSMMLSTYYNAGFTSILAFPRYTEPISTIQDMIDKNIYWGGTDWSAVGLLRHYNNSKAREIRRRFVLETNVTKMKWNIKKNNYAMIAKHVENIYVSNEVTTYQSNASERVFIRSKMKVLSESIDSFGVIIPLRKNFPFTNIIKRRVQRIMESGLMLHWYGDVQRKFNETFDGSYFKTFGGDSFKGKPLNLIKVYGLFYILGLGFGLGLICFVGEVFKGKYLRVWVNKLSGKYKSVFDVLKESLSNK